MRFIISIILTTSLVACSGSSSTKQDEPETVQMKEHVQESEVPPDTVAPAPPHVAPPEEELAVEIVDLEPGRPVETESGMTIRMTSGAPTFRFEFARGGETEMVQHSGEPLYIEGIAFGNLFTISRFGDAVQANLRSDAPRAPLVPEAAFEIARQERTSQLGCSGPREETTVLDNGTVALSVLNENGTETCRIIVGRYTGRVVDL